MNVSSDILQQPITGKIIKILQYVAAEDDKPYSGDSKLFEILHFDLFNVPHIEIARISVALGAKKYRKEAGSIRKLLQELLNAPALSLFDPNLHPALAAISSRLEKCIAAVPLQTPDRLFETCIRETGILEHIMQRPDKDQLLYALDRLFDLLNEELRRNPAYTLQALVRTITLGANSATRQESGRPAPFAIGKAEERLIGKQLEKFVMTVSALNCYLSCPREFYFRFVLRSPSGHAEALGFGSAVHFALQRLFEKMRSHPLQWFPSKEEMLQDYHGFLQQHSESFSKQAFDRRLVYGKEVLGKYYDQYIGSWNKIVAVERNIGNVVVRGIPLRGKPDKMEFNGKDVNVVDYKTGNPEKNRDRLTGPGDKQPNGGDYWRQAVFYKILIDNYTGKRWKVVSTQFDFVEAGANNEYHKPAILIQPQDVETVTRQIIDAWSKIQGHEFYAGCGRRECGWCGVGY